MGLVYRVHHIGWNIDLAVKTARPELVSSPQRMSDFEAEAQTWVGLGLHPRVVACVYVRRLDGLPRVFAVWSLAEFGLRAGSATRWWPCCGAAVSRCGWWCAATMLARTGFATSGPR
jgi:hypothetical protein